MTLRKSNIEYLRIFACPEGCRKKPFDSIMALNIHLNKVHNVKYKIYLNNKGRALARMIYSIPAQLSIKVQ